MNKGSKAIRDVVFGHVLPQSWSEPVLQIQRHCVAYYTWVLETWRWGGRSWHHFLSQHARWSHCLRAPSLGLLLNRAMKSSPSPRKQLSPGEARKNCSRCGSGWSAGWTLCIFITDQLRTEVLTHSLEVGYSGKHGFWSQTREGSKSQLCTDWLCRVDKVT